MRTLTFIDKGKIDWREAPEARVEAGIEAVVRPSVIERCQSVPFGASYRMGREGNFGGAAADRVRVPFADAMLFPLPEAAEALDWIGFAYTVRA